MYTVPIYLYPILGPDYYIPLHGHAVQKTVAAATRHRAHSNHMCSLPHQNQTTFEVHSCT